MSEAAKQDNSKPHQGSRLAILEARVDALASADDKRRTRGIKDPGTLVAIAAFIISVVTTVTSGYRAYMQDIDAKKSQLRTLLLDLNSGTLQGVELSAKYKNDPALATIAILVNTNRIVTVKQAYSLVKELGRNATATDLDLVASQLGNIGEIALAEELGLKALDVANNATEYTAAARTIGMLKLTHRQVAEAEVYFRKALSVFDIYPSDTINEQNVAFNLATTQMYWAGASIDCSMALGHVKEASNHIAVLGRAAPAPLVSWRDSLLSSCSMREPGQPPPPAAASPQATQPLAPVATSPQAAQPLPR